MLCREQELTRKLGVELRPHIRAISNYPLFSAHWCSITETLQHVASVALMESTNSVESLAQQPTESGTRKGSLWDREDLCIRFILEEGKLNMLIRMLYDTKALYRKCKKEPDHLMHLVEKSGSPMDLTSVEGKLQVLEGSVGTILKVAFENDEVLQTCDMPLLVQHVAEVLQFCVDEEEELEASQELSTSQESMVFHYLKDLAEHLHILDEERVFDLLVEHRIIPIVTSFLHVYHNVLSLDTRYAAALFFAQLCSAELFKGYQKQLFPEKEDSTRFLDLKDPLFGSFLADSTLRKQLRPLADFLTRLKMLSK